MHLQSCDSMSFVDSVQCYINNLWFTTFHSNIIKNIIKGLMDIIIKTYLTKCLCLICCYKHRWIQYIGVPLFWHKYILMFFFLYLEHLNQLMMINCVFKIIIWYIHVQKLVNDRVKLLYAHTPLYSHAFFEIVLIKSSQVGCLERSLINWYGICHWCIYDTVST